MRTQSYRWDEIFFIDDERSYKIDIELLYIEDDRVCVLKKPLRFDYWLSQNGNAIIIGDKFVCLLIYSEEPVI